MRVPLEKLRFPEPVPAGMNYLKLGHYAYRLRTSTDDLEPVEVEPLDDGTYRLTDGRHRAVANMIAGRPDVLARTEP